MLTYDQIITLSDKGFTPDQIVKLTGEEIPEPVPETVPETVPEETQEQEPEQESEQEPANDTAPDPFSPLNAMKEAVTKFSAEVAEMRKALQASNIRNIIRDDIPPSASADDILAEMIHPTINKEVTKK